MLQKHCLASFFLKFGNGLLVKSLLLVEYSFCHSSTG